MTEKFKILRTGGKDMVQLPTAPFSEAVEAWKKVAKRLTNKEAPSSSGVKYAKMIMYGVPSLSLPVFAFTKRLPQV